MLEQSSIGDFKGLCQQYGLPEDEKAFCLAMIFEAGECIMPASKGLPGVFEQARMLKQLSFAGRGFSLLVGGIKEDYDAGQVEVLEKALVDALRQRVAKRTFEGRAELGINVPANLLEDFKGLSVNMIFGPVSGVSERTIWLHPEGCQPQEEGFNLAELDAIIALGDELKGKVEKLQGNKERWENEGRSRLPELGSLAVLIKSYLPGEWEVRKQHTFIADFLFGAGFLDFKGELWKEAFKGKNPAEKDRMVRDWIKAYQSVKDKLERFQITQ